MMTAGKAAMLGILFTVALVGLALANFSDDLCVALSGSSEIAKIIISLGISLGLSIPVLRVLKYYFGN